MFGMEAGKGLEGLDTGPSAVDSAELMKREDFSNSSTLSWTF